MGNSSSYRTFAATFAIHERWNHFFHSWTYFNACGSHWGCSASNFCYQFVVVLGCLNHRLEKHASATSFGGIDVCYAPSSDLSENNHAAINWPRICCRSRPPCRLWIVHWTGLKTSDEICQCNSGMRTTPQSHSCTNCVDCSSFGSAVHSCWAIARNCASCCFPRSLCEIAVLNGGSLRHLFPTRNYFASCTCC